MTEVAEKTEKRVYQIKTFETISGYNNTTFQRCPECLCLAGIIINGAVGWDIGEHMEKIHGVKLRF